MRVDPADHPTLRRLVLAALARTVENGYPLDPDDRAEAIDLMDTDADVEAYATEMPVIDDAIDLVTGFVAEYRAGARS